jgi:hypothetical protein
MPASSWLMTIPWLASFGLGCSTSSEGPTTAGDAVADSAGDTRGTDGPAPDGSLKCGSSNNPSGSCGSCAPPYTYRADQTSACACDTTKLPGGTGGAGQPCNMLGSAAADCAPVCCTCTNGKGSFAAAACVDGHCADTATTCATVSSNDFAKTGLCN